MIRHPAAQLLATALAASMLLACTGEEPKPVATEVTPTATAEKPDFRSPPTPTRTPRPTVEPPALTGNIVGWFTDKRPAPPIRQRTLPSPPASPFALRTHVGDVVLYDMQTMTE